MMFATILEAYSGKTVKTVILKMAVLTVLLAVEWVSVPHLPHASLSLRGTRLLSLISLKDAN